MKLFLALMCVVSASTLARDEADSLNLDQLLLEALRNNPEIRAHEHNRDALEERISQESALDDPELEYMREEMPGFRWSEAMYSKVGLMQMFRFPGKLSAREDIARITAEHAHHDLMEKVNEVFLSVRSAYFQLWFAQQSALLNRENRRLLQQFADAAQTRFGVGESPQQDVLKAYVELAKLDNEMAMLRQQELSAKATLRALLNRPPGHSLGMATVDGVSFTILPLDTLHRLAMRFRPLLWHDSLSIQESERMVALAEREYYPDFRLGVEYVTAPQTGFTGWSLTAGITLPFAPWTLSKSNARVEEASIGVHRAREMLNGSRNMVSAEVSDLYFQSQSLTTQLSNYSRSIVPRSQQSLQASLIAYQTGKADFLMVIDSFRMLVELSVQQLTLRLELETVIAQLKRTVGYADIVVQKEGN